MKYLILLKLIKSAHNMARAIFEVLTVLLLELIQEGERSPRRVIRVPYSRPAVVVILDITKLSIPKKT